MPIVKVDRKGRITLPKHVATQFQIRHGQSLLLKPSADALVLRRLTPRSKESEDTDPLLWDMRHPLKTKLKGKALRKRLKEIQEEMWLP